jgi:hypothetical protein
MEDYGFDTSRLNKVLSYSNHTSFLTEKQTNARISQELISSIASLLLAQGWLSRKQQRMVSGQQQSL